MLRLRYLFIFFFGLSVAHAAPQYEVSVAGLFGLTGPVAHIGVEYKNGSLLAVEDVNKHGAVSLTFVVDDHGYSAAKALSSYKKLSIVNGIKVFHILGSPPTLAIKPHSEKKGDLVFSAAAHADILDDSDSIMQHAGTADSNAYELVEVLMKSNPKKVVCLTAESDFTESILEYLQVELSKQGVKELITETHIPTEVDFRSTLTKLVRAKPDVFIVNSVGAAPGLIIKQLKQLGYGGDIYATIGFSISKESQDIVRDNNVSGFYYQDYPSPPAEFVDQYKQKFQEVPSASALFAYTNIELLGIAVEKVGIDVPKLAKYIRQLETFEGKYATIEIASDGLIQEKTVVKEWKGSTP